MVLTTTPSVSSALRRAPAEVFVIPPNAVAVEVSTSSDLSSALQELNEQGATGINVVPILRLGPHRYTIKNGLSLNLPGLILSGVPGQTQIEFTGGGIATVQAPDMATGYPNLRRVDTQCVGIHLNGVRAPMAQCAYFFGIHFVGVTGSAPAAGHYTALSLLAQDVSFDRCYWTNEQSTAYDATAGIKSAYKALSKRNFTSLTLVHCGADYWIEPDVGNAHGCSNVSFTNCRFDGEPLAETSGGTAALNGVRMRKCHGILWNNNAFGRTQDTREAMASEVIFVANPSADDSLTIADWNPWTKEAVNVTYIYKDALGSDTATVKEVLRHASDAKTNADRLSDKINTQRASQGGLYFTRSKKAGDYLPGGSSEAAIRFEQGVIGDATAAPSDIKNINGYRMLPTMAALGGTGVDGRLTLRAISNGSKRTFTWKHAIVTQDSITATYGTTTFGPDVYGASAFLDQATDRDAFGTNMGEESGHSTFHGWIGHGIGLFVTDAFWRFQSATYVDIDKSNNLGVIGSPSGISSKASIIKVQPGMHRQWTLTQSGQPNDTDTVTIDDGNSTPVVFEFDSNSTFTGGRTQVVIGATAAATLRNLRAAIQGRIDAHVLHVSTRLNSATVLDVRFWTETHQFATTPGITESATNYAAANISQPWAPNNVHFGATTHYAARLDDSNMIVGWFEKVVEDVTIDCVVNHERPTAQNASGFTIPYTESAQAEHFILLNSVPAVGAEVILNSIDAGAPGTAVTFRFDTTLTGGSDTLVKVDINGPPSLATLATTLRDAINTSAAANSRAFFATRLTSSNGELALLPGEGVRVLDGQPGVNASLVTRGAGGADPGAAVTIGPAELWPPSSPVLTLGTNGLASIVEQGEHAPFVFIDCRMVNLRVTGTPLSIGSHAVGMGSFDNVNTYVAYPGLTTDSGPIGKAFGGGRKQLAYFAKTSAAIAMKARIHDCMLDGPWGAGRVAGTTATHPLYDLGADVVAADIITTAGTNWINGAAV